MVAVAFGSYATSLFIGNDAAAGWDNVFTSGIVVAMAGINLIGARFVDRAQSLIVVVLLAVFAVFIVATLVDIDPHLLAFSGYPPVSDIIASVALTFFAYLGFSVITFAVGDLRDPGRELPKAMYLALGVTSVTYVLIALGVFGTLTVTEVVGFGETAIAEAARPTLGDAGFTIMAVAALLATASSVNATLYASSGLTAMLAEVGQFPPFFGRGSPLGSKAGLLITAAIVLVVSNLVDLSAIASVGSACSLLIFLLVGMAGYRLRSSTGARGSIVLRGCWRRASCSSSSRSTRCATRPRHSWPSSRSLLWRCSSTPSGSACARSLPLRRGGAAGAASSDVGDVLDRSGAGDDETRLVGRDDRLRRSRSPSLRSTWLTGSSPSRRSRRAGARSLDSRGPLQRGRGSRSPAA